jgi:hypothetical protein
MILFVGAAPITLGATPFLKNYPAVFEITRADAKILLLLKLNHFIFLVYVSKTVIVIWGGERQ